ncbi:hypothetical protein T12_9196 [Trichinella patagoniensis]|uniref:Uncharacterized protein n=1 Tax=Trichinella patagoniensis TaxID=990121 RepID=A0A0V0Z0T5_9BILA|nr:hypothetical protein T12_4435 [Trichinella patagoniensis]KRY06271.1 hypothetical protein T12_1992 [Trichinella patagoniensis]KRY06340.1 hypothetical protein T12_9196 [Trichinella patagoniensis]
MDTLLYVFMGSIFIAGKGNIVVVLSLLLYCCSGCAVFLALLQLHHEEANFSHHRPPKEVVLEESVYTLWHVAVVVGSVLLVWTVSIPKIHKVILQFYPYFDNVSVPSDEACLRYPDRNLQKLSTAEQIEVTNGEHPPK